MLAFECGVLVLVGGLLLLIRVGLQDGDREGDVLVMGISPREQPRGLSVRLTNPGRVPVLVGLSLRRRGIRLRLETGTYVSRGRTATAPLPAVVGVLAPGETGSLTISAPPGLSEQAELQVVAGQEARLRIIHREVRIPRDRPRAGWPAPAPSPVGAGISAE